ncbi:hypothetical protein [Burkholderia orbicola]
MMIRNLLATALAAPLVALAQIPSGFPAGIPQNCFSPMAHDMARSGIPALLHVAANDPAHIVAIKFLKNSEAFDLGGGHYRLNCKVKVTWSSGASDDGYWFSMWEDPTGQLQGYYGRNL